MQSLSLKIFCYNLWCTLRGASSVKEVLSVCTPEFLVRLSCGRNMMPFVVVVVVVSDSMEDEDRGMKMVIVAKRSADGSSGHK